MMILATQVCFIFNLCIIVVFIFLKIMFNCFSNGWFSEIVLSTFEVKDDENCQKLCVRPTFSRPKPKKKILGY